MPEPMVQGDSFDEAGFDRLTRGEGASGGMEAQVPQVGMRADAELVVEEFLHHSSRKPGRGAYLRQTEGLINVVGEKISDLSKLPLAS